MLSAAEYALFAAARQEKKPAQDADRLRKYPARFALDLDLVQIVTASSSTQRRRPVQLALHSPSSVLRNYFGLLEVVLLYQRRAR